MRSRPVTSSTDSTFRIGTWLVGESDVHFVVSLPALSLITGDSPIHVANHRPYIVLYHQPEKMAKSQEDLAERQENLEKLKRQHGIE